MPETQAKSGGPGSSATPGEAAEKDSAAANGREDGSRTEAPADSSSPPKFTRAPGMAPPPVEPTADSDGSSDAKRPGTPSAAKGSAAVPVVTKGKGAAPGSPAARPMPAGPKPATTPQRPAGTGATGTGTGSPKTGAGGTLGSKTGGTLGSKTGGTLGSKPGGTLGSNTGAIGTGTVPGTPAAGGPPPPQSSATKQRPGGVAGSAAVGAARVSEAVRSARSTVSSAAARGPRRARLNLKRIDPWSVMKFSFAVSVVLFIVVVVATSVLYLALDAMGVWGEVNSSLKELVSSTGGQEGASNGGFQITAWGVIGTSMLIGAVNVVLFTALATLGAFIYNVCADLVGGIELTLAERD